MPNSTNTKIVKAFSAVGAVAFLATGGLFLLNSKAVLSAVSDPAVLAAQYVAGRNFAVGTLLLAALIKGQYRPLAWLLLLVSGFEAFDAIVGLFRGVPSLIVPSFLLAIGFGFASSYLFRLTKSDLAG